MKTKKQKHPKYDFNKDGVTKTLLGTWLECRRKADYFLQGWSPTQLPIYITWGNIFHDVTALIYERKVLRKKKITDHGVIKAIQKCSKTYLDPTWTADQMQEFQMMLGQISAVVGPYFTKWKKKDKKVKWLPFEETFKVKITPPKEVKDEGGKSFIFDNGFTIQGRWDGMFERGKELWIKETKTKVQFQPNLPTVIHRDLQVNFYILAAEALTGKRVSGVLYDLVRRPSLRKHKGSKNKPAEPMVDFIARIRADVESRPDHYFQRFEVVVDPDEFQIWKETELPTMLFEFKDWLEHGRGGPKIGMPCMNRFGNLCEFFQICFFGETSSYKVRDVVFPELED